VRGAASWPTRRSWPPPQAASSGSRAALQRLVDRGPALLPGQGRAAAIPGVEVQGVVCGTGSRLQQSASAERPRRLQKASATAPLEIYSAGRYAPTGTRQATGGNSSRGECGMQIAVVTGGAGFLGSHLCDFLLRDGYRVVCIDNLDTGSLENIEHIDNGQQFRFIQHDLTEPLFLEEPVDVVFHLASPASPIDYQRLPLHTLKVGSYGTHHMLGLAKLKRARFLLASTSEVYGDPQVHPQPETYWGHVNAVGPRGVYDEAKRYAEALTMAYHRQQGVDTCIARIFNTYGARMRPHDGRAIPTFLRQALGGEPLTVFGDGSQTRSFCHVDDLVRGLSLLAQSDEHLPVNLGNPREMSLLELAETVIRVTGSKSEIVFAALPMDDPQVRQPDITRARQVLGWEPEIELEDGLRRTIGTLGEAMGLPGVLPGVGR
jgi:dTDP-glucose 4,6-dehydratase